jgi:nucleotide-binding universal stress UspA family protein
MLKDIAAIVDGSERSYPSVDIAIDFARHHQARLSLSVLFEQVSMLAATDPGGYAIALAANEDIQREELKVIRDKVAQAELGIVLRSVCTASTEFPRLACGQSRTADLALIGPASGWNSANARRHTVEALIVQAGAPTLLHPAGWEPGLFRHAVLGWNGSPQAARAARTLITVLEPGATIDVLMVDESDRIDDNGDACREIGDHLARHGFSVDLHVRPAHGQPASELLESFTRIGQAQLLAIGCYTHSRLRESLFGGVTQALIDAPHVPVLMVH